MQKSQVATLSLKSHGENEVVKKKHQENLIPLGTEISVVLKFIVRLPIVAKIADIEVGSILPRKRESRLDIFIGDL